LSGDAKAVCILNTTKTDAVKLDWKTVDPIAGKKTFQIRDLWVKNDLATADKTTDTEFEGDS